MNSKVLNGWGDNYCVNKKVNYSNNWWQESLSFPHRAAYEYWQLPSFITITNSLCSTYFIIYCIAKLRFMWLCVFCSVESYFYFPHQGFKDFSYFLNMVFSKTSDANAIETVTNFITHSSRRKLHEIRGIGAFFIRFH